MCTCIVYHNAYPAINLPRASRILNRYLNKFPRGNFCCFCGKSKSFHGEAAARNER